MKRKLNSIKTAVRNNFREAYKFFLLFVFSLVSILPCFSQDEYQIEKNTFYGEVIGNSQTILSLNYERILKSSNASITHHGMRLGLGIGSNQYDQKTFFSFPLEFNTIIGDRHNLEIGCGATFLFGTSSLNNPKIPEGYRTNYNYLFILRVGYRHITNNGFLFRLAPLLLFEKSPPQSNNFKPKFSLGISFGRYF